MDDEFRSRLERVEQRQDGVLERLPVVEHRLETVERDVASLGPKVGQELVESTRTVVKLETLEERVDAIESDRRNSEKVRGDRKWLAIAAAISSLSLIAAVVFGVLQVT